MKPEIQRQNAITQRAALARRNMTETQRGQAFRYKPFDPAQFCRFAEATDALNWECVNCGRKIAKRLTGGNKPIVMCNQPVALTPEEKAALYPVVLAPNAAGGVVPRRHRTAPTYGVGFELKKIFRRLEIELPAGCVCNSRVMLLNDIGIDETEKMRDKILQWFEEEASNRALAYNDVKANKILDIAIRRARKLALKQIQDAATQDNG